MALVKRILRYLKETIYHGIFFPKNCKDELVGFNSDWCGDKEDRKSIIGYFFKFQALSVLRNNQ